jgi:hypothetical protein
MSVERRPTHPLWQAGLAAILTVLPLLALVAIVGRYHVDVFYWDQWELVPIVDKLYLGTLSFTDLWAQHNEHRPFFPRLVLAYLARATGWNTMAEVTLNMTMVTALLPVLWWATRSWRRRPDEALPPWTWPVVSLLLFSPTQWENWLWGWQFLAFVQVVSSVIGLALLTRPSAGWGALASAAALGIVGTYSFGAGLLYWPVGLVAILVRPHPARRWRTLMWMAIAAVAAGAYAQDFHGNPYMPTPISNFVRIRAFGKYLFFVATFLGAPLAPHDWRLALLAGVAGLLLFGGLTWRSLRQGTLPTAELLPLVLGLSALATAAMIGLGRAGFGFEQALESRYITSSLWLWIAVVLSLARFTVAARSQPHISGRLGSACTASVVAIAASVVLVGWPHGRRESAAWQQRLAPARAALIEGTDFQMLERLYPMPEAVVERREMLKRWHLSVFREDQP